MRALVIVAVCSIGCGGAPTPAVNGTAPTNPLVRTDLHCTMRSTDEEATCHARGAAYSLRAPLHCYGTNPGDEARKEERLAYEASSEPCACISPKEIEDCSTVP